MAAFTSSLNVVSSDRLLKTSRPSECAVCEAPAFYRHFGSKPVCKSCASFFRRSVALKLTYKCRTSGQCSLRNVRPSLACKLCRFRKCIAAGMSVIAVVSSPPTEVVDTPLDRLVQARKSVLINRFRFASELFEKLQMQRQSPLSMTTHSCDVAVQAEFLVVSNFVKHSEFLDILVGDARSTCPRIAASFLSTWILFEFMLTTIRNFGHCSRRLFFLDESYLDLTEAAVSAYYATDANLLDPWHAGRIGVSTFVDTLEVSAKLARSRLDDVESTVLTFILFIRSADLHGVDSAHLSAMLNEVFRNLAMHYQQSYEDYALRLDVIVHMADEILRIRRLFDEHNIILRLYGRATMKSRIEDSVRQGKSLPVEEID